VEVELLVNQASRASDVSLYFSAVRRLLWTHPLTSTLSNGDLRGADMAVTVLRLISARTAPACRSRRTACRSRKRLTRDGVVRWGPSCACVMALEACCGAHHLVACDG
jgi:hypothetical protein